MIKQFLKNELRDYKNYPSKTPTAQHLLNANENAYNLMDCDKIQSEILEKLSRFPMNRYPDPNSTSLRKKLADTLDIEPENILCGNGCDEIISLIIHTFLNPADVVVMSQVTFDMYEIYTRAVGGRCVQVPNAENYVIDTRRMIQAANEERAKILFLCRPNNPTGYFIPREEILEVLDKTDCLVVVDEAYVDFAGEKESVIDLLKKYDRLLILRSFSKSFSLAGIRVGYLIAHPEVVEAVHLVRSPYNVGAISQMIAEIALDHVDFFQANTDTIIRERERYTEALDQYPEIRVYDSRCNFVFLTIDDSHLFRRISKRLAEASIAVRTYDNNPQLRNAMRISVGVPEVNEIILKIFKEQCHEKSTS